MDVTPDASKGLWALIFQSRWPAHERSRHGDPRCAASTSRRRLVRSAFKIDPGYQAISKQKREYIIAPLSFFLGEEDLDAVVKTKQSGIAVPDHRIEWRK